MQIRITRSVDGYLATFIGGDMDGATMLTPHTPGCPINVVVADLQRCNPDAVIISNV